MAAKQQTTTITKTYTYDDKGLLIEEKIVQEIKETTSESHRR